MTTHATAIRVWDLPTRVFHWLLATSFAIAFATAESERWRDVHVMAGYAVAGLIVFRLLWGFVGGEHARFADFVPTPARLKTYLASLASGRPQHYVGHNPAGAVAIFALLALGLLASASGYLVYENIGGHGMEEVHEGLSNGMMLVVGIHLLGVVVSSWLHRENLIRAMITGWKKPAPAHENPAD